VCPEWKAQQKIPWAEGWRVAGRDKSRFKIRDLLAGGRGAWLPLRCGYGKAGRG